MNTTTFTVNKFPAGPSCSCVLQAWGTRNPCCSTPNYKEALHVSMHFVLTYICAEICPEYDKGWMRTLAPCKLAGVGLNLAKGQGGSSSEAGPT